MRRNLRDFGFPVLVLAALAASGYLTASVRVPDPVPDFALQAGAVYRLEVGAACFAAFYLAAIAFFLALDGRGFAELGTRSLKATKVIQATDTQQLTLARHLKLDHNLESDLKKTDAAVQSAFSTLSEHEDRLAKLEEERLN